MRRRTLVAGAAGVALLGATAGSLAVGEALSRPVRHPVGPPPAGLAAESVDLRTAAGDVVRGWFGAGLPGAGALLLLHGVRSDRRAMIGRARWLAGLGIAWPRRLFDAANAPRALWMVEGAAHVDPHAFDRAAYEARVGAFLRPCLQRFAAA